jgi:hypothetical protein
MSLTTRICKPSKSKSSRRVRHKPLPSSVAQTTIIPIDLILQTFSPVARFYLATLRTKHHPRPLMEASVVFRIFSSYT